MGLLPRRSQPVSPPLRLWVFRGPAPRGLGPFPAPVPPLPSFVFVLAATLVACLSALVLEVSFVSYVSESSWETDFSGDEFVTGGPTWCEKSFVSCVSESSWETAFSDDKFMTVVATWFETESGDNELVPSGCVLWNVTDSLNSVSQSQKFVHFPLGEFS